MFSAVFFSELLRGHICELLKNSLEGQLAVEATFKSDHVNAHFLKSEQILCIAYAYIVSQLQKGHMKILL